MREMLESILYIGGFLRVPLGKPHRKVTDGLTTPGHGHVGGEA